VRTCHKRSAAAGQYGKAVKAAAGGLEAKKANFKGVLRGCKAALCKAYEAFQSMVKSGSF
jgi:hypothetical protein